jgi:hypothetical protein
MPSASVPSIPAPRWAIISTISFTRCRPAPQRGIEVSIRTRCRVIDAVSEPAGMTLMVKPRGGRVFTQRFDHVVLATGHQWPADPQVRRLAR